MSWRITEITGETRLSTLLGESEILERVTDQVLNRGDISIDPFWIAAGRTLFHALIKTYADRLTTLCDLRNHLSNESVEAMNAEILEGPDRERFRLILNNLDAKVLFNLYAAVSYGITVLLERDKPLRAHRWIKPGGARLN